MADDTARCGRCGEVRTLDQYYDGRTAIWCKPCYRDWHRQRYEPKGGATDDPRECRQCGILYAPRSRQPSWFCSRVCKERHRTAQTSASTLAGKSVRTCLWCSGTMPPSMRVDATFCSERCNSSAHSVTRKMFRRSGERGRANQALVLLAALGLRDGWRCGICGKKVNHDLRHPDLLAPSVDHIVPLARGGTNDPGNLQIAHFRCNFSKRGELLGNAQPHLF